jgi:dihydroorotase-like cyclic amidohydrolase
MTAIVLEKARIVDPSRGLDGPGTVIVKDGRIAAAGADALNQGGPEGAEIVDCTGLVVMPGLVDAHVHVGEPGAEHRETIASASRAAAAGGVTSIVTMPDTDPVIDDVALVEFVLRSARDTAIVNVHPAAAITKGLAGREMTEFALLKGAGAVGMHLGDSREHLAEFVGHVRLGGEILGKHLRIVQQVGQLSGSGLIGHEPGSNEHEPQSVQRFAVFVVSYHGFAPKSNSVTPKWGRVF